MKTDIPEGTHRLQYDEASGEAGWATNPERVVVVPPPEEPEPEDDGHE